MNVTEINILHEKAKDRNDGVYSFRGNFWAVKSKRFIAYINDRGQVLRRFGAFDSQIGDLSELPRYEWKKKLIEFLRKQ